ncbi:type II secretion system F family protein [Millisia brevis]|uniref:type II secretion system F family protein n=1 Tax=Millisia brevis TaxID=264148 RepID=UPI0008378B86|nr:type II secretion system F family protein [Millisia brevis]
MIGALLVAAAALAVVSFPRRRVRQPRRPSASQLRSIDSAAILPLVVALIVPAVSLWAGWAVGVSVVVLGATLRARRRALLAARTRERDQRATSTGLEAMVAELRVGADPAAACTAAADEIALAMGAERRGSGTDVSEGRSVGVGEVFRRAAAGARLGGPIAAAFAAAETPALRRVGRVAELTDRYGLEAAVLLEAVRSDLERRLRFEARVRSALAGARATATVLALLPVPGVALGQLMGAQPFAVLLGSGWGGALLAIGVTLACLGVLWSDAITDRAAR